jgi:hypothetical protein
VLAILLSFYLNIILVLSYFCFRSVLPNLKAIFRNSKGSVMSTVVPIVLAL